MAAMYVTVEVPVFVENKMPYAINHPYHKWVVTIIPDIIGLCTGLRHWIYHRKNQSMDWFKGKFTGNHGFYHEIGGVPVNFPLNQSIEPNQKPVTPCC